MELPQFYDRFRNVADIDVDAHLRIFSQSVDKMDKNNIHCQYARGSIVPRVTVLNSKITMQYVVLTVVFTR